jgi:hypothetical protein
VENPEGKKPFERPRRIWADNIKLDFKATGWQAWTSFIRLRIRTVGGVL